MMIVKCNNCILKKSTVTYHESDEKMHMNIMNSLKASGMRE